MYLKFMYRILRERARRCDRQTDRQTTLSKHIIGPCMQCIER